MATGCDDPEFMAARDEVDRRNSVGPLVSYRGISDIRADRANQAKRALCHHRTSVLEERRQDAGRRVIASGCFAALRRAARG